ncbi:MAG: hypothetical protein ABJE95_25105 [Byssovorax sp.]
MIRSHALAVALVALAASGCKSSLPEDLGTVEAGKAAIAAVQTKLGTKDIAVHRLDLEHDKITLRVVDPKDPKKILEFDAEKGEMVGPSPVGRVGDTTSDVIAVKVADLDFAGLAKAEAECKTKLGQPSVKLSLWDGVDIVHHERGPQKWIVNTKDGKFCRASLPGVIDFP